MYCIIVYAYRESREGHGEGLQPSEGHREGVSHEIEGGSAQGGVPMAGAASEAPSPSQVMFPLLLCRYWGHLTGVTLTARCKARATAQRPSAAIGEGHPLIETETRAEIAVQPKIRRTFLKTDMTLHDSSFIPSVNTRVIGFMTSPMRQKHTVSADVNQYCLVCAVSSDDFTHFHSMPCIGRQLSQTSNYLIYCLVNQAAIKGSEESLHSSKRERPVKITPSRPHSRDGMLFSSPLSLSIDRRELSPQSHHLVPSP